MDKEKLHFTATQMMDLEKGLLAADESSVTIKKRFDLISLDANEKNRRAYLELLFTAPKIEKYISGVIMFEETLRQKDESSISFIEVLKKRGILSGIKVDLGLENFADSDVEKFTVGLNDL